MFSFIHRIIDWYRTNYVPYVTLCPATEHVFISRALWRRIIRNLPPEQRSDIRVYFEKYPTIRSVGSGAPSHMYRFFVNPDLSFVHAPDGSQPFTTQIQFGRFGHLGFQSVQPTPVEVLTEYRIADADFVANHFADYVSLRVSFDVVAETGEPSYTILPVEVLTRHRPDADDPDPKTLLQ